MESSGLWRLLTARCERYQKAASPGHSEQLCESDSQDEKVDGGVPVEQGGGVSVKQDNN